MSNDANSAAGGASGADAPQPPPQSLEEANQRYAATKTQLRSSLARKRQMDKSLVDLETQIYVFEGSYLSSTAASGGNIVKGFDSYLKTTNPNAASMAAIAGGKEVPAEDRMFSASSATYERSLELSIAASQAGSGGGAGASGSGSGSGHRTDTPPPSAGDKASPAGTEKGHKSSASSSSQKLKRKNEEQNSGKNHKKKKADD